MANLDTDLKYWVCFSRIAGMGHARIRLLLDHFGNLENAWKANTAELIHAGLDAKLSTAISENRKAIEPDQELENLEKYGIRAVPFISGDYPGRLLEISDYPAVLYLRGSSLPDDELSIAVVGTRRVSIYGRQATEEIVADLTRSGITIISGLAKGTDTIAHRVTLEMNGRTVAVFACGLDIVYPAENARLARQIMETGVLVSEYPLGTKPRAENFPRRNRIMSGLSLGVLVIEAGEKSGALITAEQALTQNREVFAVPGSIFSPYSKGTNKLIQQGAKLVRNYLDVLEELNLSSLAQQLEVKQFLASDKNEAILLEHLTQEPRHIDEICRLSSLPSQVVSSTLAILELKGIIKQIGNLNYTLAKGVR